MSLDGNMYNVLKGLLNGSQKHTLDSKVVMNVVQAQAISSLRVSQSLVVPIIALHDGCEIRKPDATSMEYIGKVLSLKKQVINGYKTMNSVSVDVHGTGVTLLNHQLYSTGMPDFVCQSTILSEKERISKLRADLQSDNLSEAEKASHRQSIATAEVFEQQIAQGQYINSTKAYLQSVQNTHDTIRAGNEKAVITHVQDREFDGEAYFEYIDDLKDEFITRAKLSRLSNKLVTTYTQTGKVSKIVKYAKLVEQSFDNKTHYIIDKLTIKGKTHLHVTCKIEWTPLLLNGRTYTAVKITLLGANGKPIFDNPMILITNRVINGEGDAKAVYHTYLLRFKIEIVFRFLKQQLGWETFQIRDFNSIRNILALAFFLVGYFKELQESIQNHENFHIIALLGGGKGIISTTFILQGLEKLVHFQQVQQLIDNGTLSKNDIQNMIHHVFY